MEARMESERMPELGDERQTDDQFIIIGGKFPAALKAIEANFADVEVLAPVERRMMRPRRKSSKKEPTFRSFPLFFEYMAVRWSGIEALWHCLYEEDAIWLVLLGDNELPLLVDRKSLGGMNSQTLERSWEGLSVEILSGPMKGQVGRFESGKVIVNLFGREISAQVGAFNLALAK